MFKKVKNVFLDLLFCPDPHTNIKWVLSCPMSSFTKYLLPGSVFVILLTNKHNLLGSCQFHLRQNNEKPRITTAFVSHVTFRSCSSLYSTGNGEVGGHQLLGVVPWRWLPVPLALHLLPRVGGDEQADRHRPEEHHTQDDRRPLQVQLGQEAVQSDTGQDHVGQRGRRDHSQPPLANQEATHPEKSSACPVLIEHRRSPSRMEQTHFNLHFTVHIHKDSNTCNAS